MRRIYGSGKGFQEEFKASMENGVLTVTYPRQTPEQLPKKIRIA